MHQGVCTICCTTTCATTGATTGARDCATAAPQLAPEMWCLRQMRQCLRQSEAAPQAAPAQQFLYFSGVELDNMDATVRQCGIFPRSTIEVYVDTSIEAPTFETLDALDEHVVSQKDRATVKWTPARTHRTECSTMGSK